MSATNKGLQAQPFIIYKVEKQPAFQLSRKSLSQTIQRLDKQLILEDATECQVAQDECH